MDVPELVAREQTRHPLIKFMVLCRGCQIPKPQLGLPGCSLEIHAIRLNSPLRQERRQLQLLPSVLFFWGGGSDVLPEMSLLCPRCLCQHALPRCHLDGHALPFLPALRMERMAFLEAVNDLALDQPSAHFNQMARGAWQEALECHPGNPLADLVIPWKGKACIRDSCKISNRV